MVSRPKFLHEYATIPGDMPERDQKVALMALDGLTAYYAGELWAGMSVFNRAVNTLNRLRLDMPAFLALARERADVRLEAAAIRKELEARQMGAAA